MQVCTYPATEKLCFWSMAKTADLSYNVYHFYIQMMLLLVHTTLVVYVACTQVVAVDSG